MNRPQILGIETLTSILDRDVPCADAQAVHALADRMGRLVRHGELRLLGRAARPAGRSHARHELYRSPALGYSVVGMTWSPGQSTALHDHGGVWCVEVVLRGAVEVTGFSLVEREADRYRFTPRQPREIGVGSTSGIASPHEYHVVKNARDESAFTLHVYGGPLLECGTFEPCGDGSYVRRTQVLCYQS